MSRKKLYLGMVLFGVIAVLMVGLTLKSLFIPSSSNKTPAPAVVGSEFKMKKIESEAEYKSYLQKAAEKKDFGNQVSLAQPEAAVSRDAVGAGAPIYSQTNVQVVGVDEADTVKTDSKNIYISNNQPILMYEKRIAPYPQQILGKTHVVGVDPLSNVSSIDVSGQLYLKDGKLVLLANRTLYGYDVTNSKTPKLLWKNLLDDGVYLTTSRLVKNDLYLFTKTTSSGCVIPLFRGGFSITCTDIYRPWTETDVDSVFSVLKLNVQNGEVTSDLSFLGSEASSVVYASTNNAYVTYADNLDFYLVLSEFYQASGKSFLPAESIAKIKTLDSLDISNQAKLTEISVLVENYKKNLSADELMAYESNSQNKMTTYMTEKMDEIYKTAVVKIALKDLKIQGSVIFAGYPLNQFSLDEYNDTFRVATTNGSGMVQTATESSIYVYDSAMKLAGKVTGLGKGEKIYSVRFIKDLAYVVTFKTTDPFYVVDLSNPKNPVVAGELEIPGYSSYLHPLTENIILGLGREDNKVKLSLFDVSDPENPSELDKYLGNFYWSEALDNHKAFLQKANDSLFFLPGDAGGYVFSYAGKKLDLVKAVAQSGLKRAVYIGDNWFFVSGSEVRKYDNAWKEISRLTLP